jgi:hypothetical protein
VILKGERPEIYDFIWAFYCTIRNQDSIDNEEGQMDIV